MPAAAVAQRIPPTTESAASRRSSIMEISSAAAEAAVEACVKAVAKTNMGQSIREASAWRYTDAPSPLSQSQRPNWAIYANPDGNSRFR